MTSALYRMRYGMWQPQCYRVPESPGVRITPLSKQPKMIPVVVVTPECTVTSILPGQITIDNSSWVASPVYQGVAPMSTNSMTFIQSACTIYNSVYQKTKRPIKEGDRVQLRCLLGISKMFTGEVKFQLTVTDARHVD
tara:strand:+ start:141 stop:554 length:414 start_codon:yes stop_codon:yes gene_type:complete